MPTPTQFLASITLANGRVVSGVFAPLSATDLPALGLTGDVTASVSGGTGVATIANDAVTYAKMQNVSAASKLIGRGDSGAGDPQEITLGTGLAMSGTTLNGTASTPPGGSSGQVQFNNAGAFGGAAALVYAASGSHLTATALTAADVPVVAKGTTSQSGDLFECQNTSGTVLFRVSSGGTPSAQSGTDSERFGAGASNAGNYSVAVGRDAATSGTFSVAIGRAASATETGGAGSTVVGANSTSNGSGNAILGAGQTIVGSNGTLVGNGNTISLGVAGVGLNNAVSNYGAMSFGMSNAVSHINSVLVGIGLTSARRNEAVFGSGQSTGTGAYTGGQLVRVVAETSDGTVQDVGTLDFTWAVATTASRTGRVTLRAFDYNAGREVIRIEADGSAGLLGFFAATAVVKQTSGANLTNNVTSGGTNDVIADFTDLTTYANDAAAIRNDIYQLARKLKQVNDALRAYGLLT